MVRTVSLGLSLLGWVTSVSTSSASVEEVVAGGEPSCGAIGFPDDEFAVCNVGSSCRDEYTRANGTEEKMWPEGPGGVARSRINSERNRIRLNTYQPTIVPKYTEVGYKKEKLNPHTYAYLMDWYNAQLKHRDPVSERWELDNTYANHWEIGTTMIHAPKSIQQRLFDDLQPLMEEWSGTSLKATSCYGVRHYYRGNVLANHVDRVDTHVISGIINVAQTNLDKDWPLYVRGHDGIARNLVMEPGEIIFYESTSVIHGRPEVFQGDRFANIFVHFAPTSGWDVTTRDVNMAADRGEMLKQQERTGRGEEEAKVA